MGRGGCSRRAARSMLILSWNCRGAGNDPKILTLRSFLKSTRPNFLFLSETKMSLGKSSSVLSRLGFANHFCVPSSGRAGGLWLCWDDSILANVTSSSPNHIVLKVHASNDKPEWFLVCVYGSPYRNRRYNLWDFLESFSLSCLDPWVCVGDFNAISSPSEKIGGSGFDRKAAEDFNRVLDNCGLVDLGYNGPAYTWTNKRSKRFNICERLDKAYAETSWIQLFSYASVTHLPYINSDHCPILLNTNVVKRMRKPPVRFEAFWLHSDMFQDTLHQIWNESHNGDVLQKLAATLNKLKAWSRKTFGHVSSEITCVKGKLSILQNAAFTIKEILGIYSMWSGQLINFSKSSIYFSPKADLPTCNTILAILGVKTMEADDKYLGHNLLKPKSRIASYSELIDKCRSRLKGWMSSQLSHSGRGIMIQSTLGSMSNFWTVSKASTSSSVWAGILIGRNIIAPHVCWFIGNGSMVKIWEDPWVPTLPGFHVEGLPQASTEVTYVNELICSSSRHWNIHLLQHVFLPHEISAILNIRIPAEPCPDQLLWMRTPSGDFSTKSVYRCLADNEPSNSRTDSALLDWKRFWKMRGISPRVHLFLWRLLHNAIALKTNIAKRIPTTDTICQFCFSKEETVEHLFLHCDVTKQIWFLSPIGLPRNRAIFDKVAVVVKEVVHSAVQLFAEHNASYSDSVIKPPNFAAPHSAPKPPDPWTPPPIGTVKINVDGATATHSIAAGIVARSSSGDFIEGCCMYDGSWVGSNGALEAEARAFLKGLELARDLHAPSVIIEGDSKLLVSYLIDDRLKYPWRIRSSELDCKRLLSSLPITRIQHVSRNSNKVAHLLAKFAISNRSNYVWQGTIPSCIASSMLEDKNSISSN
ncbi:Endonuclease/exonuclease/phosphatase [Macleaya cordata]|uniref:Endonuclease/exonuclease/phosphatase n=1 Tax=Macleaya cordata TaxID=56857 RepID=A0A200RDY7_MACCD|nr:Endonuclease/exonuclease/phosphatase [Macleaya cordata]